MSFGTKNVVVEERKSLGIAYGILKLKIMDFNLKAAQSGKKMLEFMVEDDTPVGEDGYEYEGVFGKRKAVNRSGMVGASIYIDVDNDTNNTDLILKGLAVLADRTGCRAELDAVEGNDFLDYMKKAVKVIGNKYVYFVVRAEEYVSQSSGKVGINRTLKTWGKESPWIIFPVEGSTVVKEGNKQILTSADGKTFTWDKDNQYDYKPFVKPDEEIQANIAANAGTDDSLPF
jgi:hypothetical protein